MMNKEIKYEDEARLLIIEGVIAINKAIKTTLGPMGKNVIIRDGNVSVITKDGITVAKAIDFSDEYKSIGVELIRDISESANDISGDGSSTAAIIGSELITSGLNLISTGKSPIAIKRGIESAVTDVINYLEKNKRDIDINNIEDLKTVALISTNGDEELSNLVADVKLKTGLDGIVNVDTTKGFDTYSTISKGFSYDQGYLSHDFITNGASMTAEYDNPIVCVTNDFIENIDQITNMLEEAVELKQPLVIVAEDIHENVINLLSMNKLNGFPIVVVKAPGFESYALPMTEDLGVYLGTELTEIGEEGYALGSAKKVIVKREQITFIEGAGKKEDVNLLVSDLKGRLKLDTVSEFDKNILKERIARLKGVVADIRVGGQTKVEQQERKDRIYDALGATTSAMEEGVIIGGGAALLKAYNNIDFEKCNDAGEKEGRLIVKESILAPFVTIMSNGNIKDIESLKKGVMSKTKNVGYDILRNSYTDMFKTGIVDPFRVTKIALTKAASIAGLFLMTDCVITNK